MSTLFKGTAKNKQLALGLGMENVSDESRCRWFLCVQAFVRDAAGRAGTPCSISA